MDGDWKSEGTIPSPDIYLNQNFMVQKLSSGED